MDRMRRISRLWNWLPHFRVVAETENLSAASATLGISPSALSRTLKLLEEDLGAVLLDRRGRYLRLNASGSALLVEVRECMQRIHACVESVSSRSSALRLSASGPLMRALVLPAAQAEGLWGGKAAALHLVHLPDSYAVSSLRQHTVDMVVMGGGFDASDLDEKVIAKTPFSCHARGRPSDPNGPFAAPFELGTGRPLDGWPEEEHRRVAFPVSCLQGVLDAVELEGALGFLPDFLGHHHGLQKVHATPRALRKLSILTRRPGSNDRAIRDTAQRLMAAMQSLLSRQICQQTLTTHSMRTHSPRSKIPDFSLESD